MIGLPKMNKCFIVGPCQGTARRENATKTRAYQAPALNKGLEVLEFFTGQTEPYAISELARALGSRAMRFTEW